MPKKKRASKEDREKCKLITPPFRGSYVTLAKPRSIEGSEPEYSIMIVISKDHNFWNRFEAAQAAAIEQKFGDDVDLDGFKLPRKDGDGKKSPDEWKGCFAVRAKCKETQGRPGCVQLNEDQELEEIEDRSELYSGAWYRATIRLAGYDHPTGGQGIGVYLDNVMKVKDDQPFSGRSSPADDFSSFVGDDADEEGETTTRKPAKHDPLA